MKKPIKIALYAIGGLFVLLFIIGIFLPKPKEEDETKMSTMQLRRHKVVAAMDAVSGGERKMFFFDSLSNPHRAEMYLFVDGSKVWDEKTFLHDHFNRSIDYAKEAFKIDGIDTAYFLTEEALTNSLGRVDTTAVLRTAYVKSYFNKVNWDNLSGRPMLSTLVNVTAQELNYMHPAVTRKLTLEDIQSITF